MSTKATRVINEALVVPASGSGFTPQRFTWGTRFIDRDGTAPLIRSSAPPAPDLPPDFTDHWLADQNITGTDPVTNWNSFEGSLNNAVGASYSAGSVSRGGSRGTITTPTGTWPTVDFNGVDQGIRFTANSGAYPNGSECTWVAVFTAPDLLAGPVLNAFSVYGTAAGNGCYVGSWNSSFPNAVLFNQQTTREGVPGYSQGDLMVAVCRFFVDGAGGVSTSQTMTHSLDGAIIHDNISANQTGHRLPTFGANYSGNFVADTKAVELLCYDRPVSDQEMSDIAANLTAKYGITSRAA